jgi:hypothetical protein
MNCNTVIPNTTSKTGFNINRDIALQQRQYLANNNSSLSFTPKLQQDLEKQQFSSNQHFINIFSKFMPTKLQGMGSTNLSLKNNQILLKSQYNQFAANPTNVFQTLLAANILRSNIQSTSKNNSNASFNNINTTANSVGQFGLINDSPKNKHEGSFSKGN